MRPPEIAFRRSHLLKALSAEEKKVCDNFLTRMRDLGAIVPDPEGGPGAYHFANQLHALYFFIEARACQGTEAPLTDDRRLIENCMPITDV